MRLSEIFKIAEGKMVESIIALFRETRALVPRGTFPPRDSRRDLIRLWVLRLLLGTIRAMQNQRGSPRTKTQSVKEG